MFLFYFSDKDEKRVGREGSSKFSYVLMLNKICTGDYFPEISIGTTLVVSFQILTLVLRGRGCERRKRI